MFKIIEISMQALGSLGYPGFEWTIVLKHDWQVALILN